MVSRILLADDHQMMREGLRSLLERQEGFDVVGEAADGAEAVEQALETEPDVVVMDLSMPVMDGIEACRQIVAKLPHTLVVGLSIHSDRRFIEGMLKAGASSYLLKDCAFEELVAAIHAVVAGNPYPPDE